MWKSKYKVLGKPMFKDMEDQIDELGKEAFKNIYGYTWDWFLKENPHYVEKKKQI